MTQTRSRWEVASLTRNRGHPVVSLVGHSFDRDTTPLTPLDCRRDTPFQNEDSPIREPGNTVDSLEKGYQHDFDGENGFRCPQSWVCGLIGQWKLEIQEEKEARAEP